jgi:hypothetical protein
MCEVGVSRRVFEISVKGAMSDLLCAEFEDVDISVGHSVTRLRVVSRDAPALHGILDRIEVLGLELLDVHLVEDRLRS